MAFLSAALPYIAAAGTVIGVGAEIQRGKAQREQQLLLARQREEDANEAAAESQRQALFERKKAKNLMSRARAVAAASGAGASDPTVTNILTDIETEGEMNYLNALYSGNSVARGLRSGANLARRPTHSNLNTASIALGGATSWYEKYGS